MLDGFAFARRETPDAALLRAAYRGVFATPAGRMVLADITACLGRVQREGTADSRAFQDGERALALRVVRMITNMEAENE